MKETQIKYLYKKLLNILPPKYKNITLYIEYEAEEYDAAACYDEWENTYFITLGIADANMLNKDQILFTLAHELAHFVLGHVINRCRRPNQMKEKDADALGLLLCNLVNPKFNYKNLELQFLEQAENGKTHPSGKKKDLL